YPLLRLSVPRSPPRSTRFPYTTLFRSPTAGVHQRRNCAAVDDAGLRVAHELRVPGHRDHRHAVADLVEHHAECARMRDRLDELRSEEHTSELQSRENLVCRLLLEKKTR